MTPLGMHIETQQRPNSETDNFSQSALKLL